MSHIAHNRSIATSLTEGQPQENQAEFWVDIVGDIQWRPGDGMLQSVPKVRAAVNEAIGSWTLSWDEDGGSVVISLSRDEFALYLERGDIVKVAV